MLHGGQDLLREWVCAKHLVDHKGCLVAHLLPLSDGQLAGHCVGHVQAAPTFVGRGQGTGCQGESQLKLTSCREQQWTS